MRNFLLVFILVFNLKSLAQNDSLDIKIGQMIMMGMYGTSVNESSAIIKDVKQGMIGGILLYERNIDPLHAQEKLFVLSNKLQQASSLPLFISMDQEGGQVNRLKEKYGFNPMPSAQSIAKKADDMHTYKVGSTIASSLKQCGINLNYAPVLDIHNPMCPVLGKRQRCYSTKPQDIYHQASITIQAHHDQQIKTVVKHFPGHGNSLNDSHLGMADVSKSWKANELLPYKKLIADSMIDMIMTAHIVNRKLDSTGLPATLSKIIITDVLRNELKYDGIVISDDMQMHAISSYYGFAESIQQCINAGVDILMFSNNIAGAENYSAKNIHATIKRLVKEGKIDSTRIDESFNRIMRLKESL